MKRIPVHALGACLIAMASTALAQMPEQGPAPAPAPGQAPAPMPEQAPPPGTGPAQGAVPPQTMPARDVSDDQLRKFVSAAQKVAMISQEYTPRLNAATDAASQQQVHKEADDKMVDAVHREGLTVDEFNGIGQAVEQDPGLAQRARSMAK